MNVPRQIRVRVNVDRLLKIDLQQQTFTACIAYEASWLEPKLPSTLPDGKSPEPALRTEEEQAKGVLHINGSEEEYFAPRLVIRNCIETHHIESWYRIRTDHPGSREKGEPPLMTGTFQEKMELRKFPVDSQNLTIEMVSLWEQGPHGGTQLVHNQSKRYSSVVSTSTFIHSKEYDLHEHLMFREDNTRPEESAEGFTYSLLEVLMRVDRNSWYWSINVILPLFIITTSTLASWMVPAKELADRCSITLTMLLAMVGFKYIVGEKLPNISYATYVDLYTIFCFTVTFAQVLAQTVLCATAGADGDQVPGHLLVVILFSAWVGVHILGYLFISGLRMRRIERAKFWSTPRTAVWVSGFPDGAFADEREDSDGMKKLKDEIRQSVKKDFGEVKTVRLFTAERAQDELTRDHGNYGLGAESSEFKGRGRSVSAGGRVWDMDTKEVKARPYTGTKAFAVIDFCDSNAADRAVRGEHQSDLRSLEEVAKADPERFLWCDPQRLEVELLHVEWYALARPRSSKEAARSSKRTEGAQELVVKHEASKSMNNNNL